MDTAKLIKELIRRLETDSSIGKAAVEKIKAFAEKEGYIPAMKEVTN